jgi:hypothetical protein
VPAAADEVRARLRRRLAEEYGMDEADVLLDRPSGGWDDLVTKDWLHLELAAIDSRFAAMMHGSPGWTHGSSRWSRD